MDCIALVEFFASIDEVTPLSHAAPPSPADVPPALIEELIAAGLLRREAPADAQSDAELTRLKARVAELTGTLRERTEALQGSSGGLGGQADLSAVQVELRLARNRLLDAAALAQERAADGLTEPGLRLTFQGRELLDELRARAWRLQGREWEEVHAELEALRRVLRRRAEAGKSMMERIGATSPRIPSIDRRAAGLLLALPDAFAEEELARARAVEAVRLPMEPRFEQVPIDLVCLLALHPHGKSIAGIDPGENPLALLSWALLDLPYTGSLAPQVEDLERQARELARGRGAGTAAPHDLLLASSKITPERLAERAFIQQGVSPRCADAEETAAVTAILLVGPDSPAVSVARFLEVDDALRALSDSPLPLPAALLCLIEGPPSEVLDNLRMACGEIERAGLGVSAAETITQGVRLLLAVGTQAVRPELVPQTRGLTATGAGIGLSVGLSLSVAVPLQGMVVQSAIHRELQSSLSRARMRHPAHRTVGFHG